FRPMVQEEKVHPGQLASETYYVRNLTNEVMTGQAVDSLVPDDATFYFKKLECLCFKHHTLGPHQSTRLTLKYIVMPGLPKYVHRIYLSYTFFEVSQHPVRAAARVSHTVAQG
ncbi:MAG: cytochrome c oxidase assembly protein, partial [Acidiferrobacteraceae bacterium]